MYIMLHAVAEVIHPYLIARWDTATALWASRRTFKGVIWAILSYSGAVFEGFLDVNRASWHLEAHISSRHPLGRPLETLETLSNSLRDVFGDDRLGSHTAHWTVFPKCPWRKLPIIIDFLFWWPSPLCRCRQSVQFSLQCACLLQSYSGDGNLGTKKKSQGEKCWYVDYFQPPWANWPGAEHSPDTRTLRTGDQMTSFSNPTLLQQMTNWLPAAIIGFSLLTPAGTRLRNLIMSGELVPKEITKNTQDDWKTSFQGDFDL